MSMPPRIWQETLDGTLWAFWLSLVVFLFPSSSLADVYSYVDGEGVIHYTNTPTQPLPQRGKLPPTRYLLLQRGKLPPTRYVSFPQGSRAFSEQKSFSDQCYDTHIKSACVAQGVDARLVKAIIKAESAFDPSAVSPKGAMGLMQLMPETSRLMGVRNPFDPTDNISGGVRYLKFLMERFKHNLVLALAAYNAGPNAVELYGGIPPYDETLVYIQRVLSYYSHYLQ